GCALAHLGRKKPMVARIGVGTAYLIDLHNVMCGDHPRVEWIKLPADLVLATVLVEPVDSIGHDQERTVVSFRHEVTERQAEGSAQTNCLLVAHHDAKVSISRL